MNETTKPARRHFYTCMVLTWQRSRSTSSHFKQLPRKQDGHGTGRTEAPFTVVLGAITLCRGSAKLGTSRDGWLALPARRGKKKV